jgi:hypothetical protein
MDEIAAAGFLLQDEPPLSCERDIATAAMTRSPGRLQSAEMTLSG